MGVSVPIVGVRGSLCVLMEIRTAATGCSVQGRLHIHLHCHTRLDRAGEQYVWCRALQLNQSFPLIIRNFRLETARMRVALSICFVLKF